MSSTVTKMKTPQKPVMTKFKLHTLIKGVIWELIGVIILFAYTWITTGDFGSASVIGIGYPAIRAVLWYPFERIYKRIRRRNHTNDWAKDNKGQFGWPR